MKDLLITIKLRSTDGALDADVASSTFVEFMQTLQTLKPRRLVVLKFETTEETFESVVVGDLSALDVSSVLGDLVAGLPEDVEPEASFAYVAESNEEIREATASRPSRWYGTDADRLFYIGERSSWIFRTQAPRVRDLIAGLASLLALGKIRSDDFVEIVYHEPFPIDMIQRATTEDGCFLRLSASI